MRRMNNKRAFTLIELLVVIAVLGVLVLIASPMFLGKTKEAFETSIIHDATLVHSAAERYYLDNGEFPFLMQENEDGELVKVEAGGPKDFEIIHKVEEFDNENKNVRLYEIDFRKLDNYVKVNVDEGYFLAAQGNPEFGTTALKPGAKSTEDRLENKSSGESTGGQEDYQEGPVIVEDRLPSKSNGYTMWEGLTPEAFDDNNSTYTSISTGKSFDVTWDKDMTNNIVEMLVGTANSATLNSAISMTIYDKEGNALEFINADTDEALQTYTLSNRSRVTKRIRFIMPENADKLTFTSDRRAGRVYELVDYEDKQLPLPITELTSERGRNNMTLNWVNPNGENFDRVAVYRDGDFVGYSTSNSYIDGPLYSDKEYNYTIQVVNKTGNRSEKTHYKTKTIIDGIVWRGLTPESLDGNNNTYTSISTGKSFDVTWDKDMTNNIVEMLVGTANSATLNSAIFMTIYDKEGNALEFINADTDTTLKRYTLSSRSRVTERIRFIMPKDAHKLTFTSDRRAGRVYELIDYEDKQLPLPVTKVTSERERNSITLNWNNPNGENSGKVAIYRDGNFVGYSNSNSYTDGPLYSDKEYNYTIQATNKTGNRSEKIHHKTKTIIDGVVWRGLTPEAFDGNNNTYTSISTGESFDVTWDKDITNDVIDLLVGTANSSTLNSAISMTIYDKEGNVLEFINADTDTTLQTYTLSSRYSVTERISFIMPKDAHKLTFTSDRRAGRVYSLDKLNN